MELRKTSSIFAALPYFFVKLSSICQSMEDRLPAAVGAMPAEAQILQQFAGIPEACTHKFRTVGIGADGENLAAAVPVKLQHRRPFFDGAALGGAKPLQFLR